MWERGRSRSGINETVSGYKLGLQTAGRSGRKKTWGIIWLHICMPGMWYPPGKKKASGMLLEEIILCYNPSCRQGFIGKVMDSLISHGQAKGCQDS